MFFDHPSSVEGPSKHVHPGSPRIEASLRPGCSGVIRDGPCWVRLWCDLGLSEPAFGPADQVVAAVTTPSVGTADLEALLRRLLPTAPAHAPPAGWIVNKFVDVMTYFTS